ncbi:MAG: hypothetical protein HFH60_03525 [Lachnospiraceae bacterium]|jgi:hypothetical protein|nr:hypothetical protein [Lachnospiraceae bacterium]
MGKRIGLENREKREVSRPINTMFIPSKEITTMRQTYHMELDIVEAIKVIDYETREGISHIMNRLLREAISSDYIAKAQENLKKRQ